MEQITTADELYELVEKAKTDTVIFFKHSNSCPTSARVFEKVQAAQDENTLTQEVHYVVVQTHRELSNDIAEEYKVTHESPQMIVIQAGDLIYDDSHLSIDPEEVADLLEEN